MVDRKIPTGWAWARVGDICDPINGRAFRPSEWKESGVPIVRIQNLKDPSAQYNYFQGKIETKFHVEKGDLLFAWSGTPGTSFGAHIWSGPTGVLNQHIFNVRFNRSMISPAYLRDALNQNVAEYVRQAQGGVGLAHITKPRFSDSHIPIPPLPEQCRIVAEIEKQFTRLDASVAALKRVQANLKRYRASVLKAACEGKLVPTEAEFARAEGRDYEPAGRLLERILAERRARWEAQEKRRGKYEEPVVPDASALRELPEGWVWATVDALLIEPLSNGRSVKTASGGFPVLRLTALRQGQIDQSEFKNGAWAAQEAERFLIQEGDFLVSRGNGSIKLVGIGGLVGPVQTPVAYPDTLIRFRLHPEIAITFFARLWNSSMIREQLESMARTTAGIYKVNQQDLSLCVIPLPPFVEQHRIVAEVERRLSVVQQAEGAVEASLKRAGRLRQSVLKQAFSGKLVPQDPNDEPAAALLERIRGGAGRAQGCCQVQRHAKTPPDPKTLIRGNTPIGRRLYDHIRQRWPEALELLQHPAGRRAVLWRLPGAAHLPHFPQDDGRAKPPALHPAAGLSAATHPRRLRLAQPAGPRGRRTGDPLPPHLGDAGPTARNARRHIPQGARTGYRSRLCSPGWSGSSSTARIGCPLSADVKGDAYESLLERTAQDVKTGAGQYFTPRPLIQAIVDFMRPEPGSTICDPACGTGGFLLAAHDYIVNHSASMNQGQLAHLRDNALHGWEIVDSTARLSVMNLYLHGIGGDETNIVVDDSLRSLPSSRFDMVLTNPPFGRKSSLTFVNTEGESERDSLMVVRDDFWATTSNKQLNFLQHVRSILEIHGRAAIVVPDNVLFEGRGGGRRCGASCLASATYTPCCDYLQGSSMPRGSRPTCSSSTANQLARPIGPGTCGYTTCAPTGASHSRPTR